MSLRLKAKDGTELYAKDWGSGSPIVLVGGWPLSCDMWEYNARVLAAAGHRVVTYDRRGFGRSGQPWSGYDYDTMADDLGAVMEQLDVTGATLVGFSMGGGEVARFCGGRGDAARVKKAVLVSAVTPYLLKTGDNPSGVDKSVFDGMIEKLETDRPAFLATLGKQLFGVGLLSSPVSDEMLQWVSGMALQASPRATLECVRAFSGTDFRADCRAIRVPTLLVHGTSDAIVPIDHSSREAAKLIAGSTLVEYDGEPHGLFYTSRDRLNQEILRFSA